MQALHMISQSEGGAAKRLLTGYAALAARNLPFTAMQFPMFEAARRKMWEWRDRKRVSDGSTVKDGSGGVGGGERKIEQGALARGLLETGYVNGASAGLSGAVAAVITTPSDVVKTRMMLSAGEERKQAQEAEKQRNSKARPTAEQTTQGHGDATKQRPKQEKGGLQVAKLVYAERGIRGLFRGGALRAGWTAVGSGLYLGTYEVAKVLLKGSDAGGRDEDDGL